MKQTHDITANHDFPDSFAWPEKNQFFLKSLYRWRQKTRKVLDTFKNYVQSTVIYFAICALFVSGSYLFFVQLAEYGW